MRSGGRCKHLGAYRVDCEELGSHFWPCSRLTMRLKWHGTTAIGADIFRDRVTATIWRQLADAPTFSMPVSDVSGLADMMPRHVGEEGYAAFCGRSLAIESQVMIPWYSDYICSSFSWQHLSCLLGALILLSIFYLPFVDPVYSSTLH